MGIFDLFRKKDEAALEAQMRDRLLHKGRITDGVVIDNEITDEGYVIVYYTYSVQGADFESSEILSAEQSRTSIKYAPGASVGVRYDPNHHGRSILV
ncbi:MAG: hypothetical protein KIS76_14765 [Pyrinomonadaceae bacterium]|nr:hypothetical protein [Pyrinomonadaceae bacterium]